MIWITHFAHQKWSIALHVSKEAGHAASYSTFKQTPMDIRDVRKALIIQRDAGDDTCSKAKVWEQLQNLGAVILPIIISQIGIPRSASRATRQGAK